MKNNTDILASHKNKLTGRYIKIQWILCFLIAVFTMLGSSPIVSVLFTLTFIVLLINFISFLTKTTMDVDILLLFFIVIISLIAVIRVSNDSLSFNYLKKYMMFCSTLMFMFIVSRAVINKELINFILKLNFILFTVYYGYFIFGYATYFEGALTLKFTNPNLLALWLLHTLLFLVISFFYYKLKIFRLVSVGAVSMTLMMILETKARSVLISLTIFTIMLILIFLRDKFKIGKILTMFLILYPIIFSVIYMAQIYNPTIIKSLNFLSSSGKGLDTRVVIWNYSFDIIRNNLFFGNYYDLSDGTGMSQLLNTHIDVMASYGCLVFLLFVLYLYRIVIRISKTCENKIQKIALASFFAIIIMGSGEAALVSGSVGMYILSCSFLLFARYNPFLESKSS